MQLNVRDSVYDPMEDSYMMQKEVQKRARDKKVLDMGTGSGIQSISAALSGAKEAFAVDLNPEAVKCCKENAKLNNVEVSVIQSNLFEKLPKNRFDLVVFNPPYLPSDGQHDDLRWSGGYEGIEVILEFFQQVSDYLAKDGEILFIFSSHANQDKLKKVLAKMGFSLEVIDKKRIFHEEIYLGLSGRRI
jgi:release factor glutamine methyltransferase